MKKISFQYKLDKKSHFKSLLKGELKKVFIMLIIFTFCYFAINMEAFLFNFPYNTPLVLITYLIYFIVIFIIMFLISLIFSYIMTNLYKKNNAYKIYEYSIDNDKITDINSAFSLNLKNVNKIKIVKKYIKIISLKEREVLTFEKENFVNTNDYNSLVKFLSNKKEGK